MIWWMVVLDSYANTLTLTLTNSDTNSNSDIILYIYTFISSQVILGA